MALHTGPDLQHLERVTPGFTSVLLWNAADASLIVRHEPHSLGARGGVEHRRRLTPGALLVMARAGLRSCAQSALYPEGGHVSDCQLRRALCG